MPLYDTDHDLKQRLRVGSVVKCRVCRPRNYEHHKKFFALVRLTFDNLPLPLVEKWNIRNEADMLRRFKRDLGYFTNTLNEYGEREIEYLSISFAAMEQHEFESFYEQCIDLVLHTYLKGTDRKELTAEVENFR